MRRSWEVHRAQTQSPALPMISSPLRKSIAPPKTPTPSPEKKNSVKQLVALFESRTGVEATSKLADPSHDNATTFTNGDPLGKISRRPDPQTPTPKSRNPSGSENEDLPYDASIETTLRVATARLASPRVSMRDLSTLAGSISASSSRSSSPGRVLRSRGTSETSAYAADVGVEVQPAISEEIKAQDAVAADPGEYNKRRSLLPSMSPSPKKRKRAQIYAELEKDKVQRMRTARRFL